MDNFNEYEDPEDWHKPIKERQLDWTVNKDNLVKISIKKNKAHDRSRARYSAKIDSVDIFEGKSNYKDPLVDGHILMKMNLNE